MAIPLNLLSEQLHSYKSKVSYLCLRQSISIPIKYTLFLTEQCNLDCEMCTQKNVKKFDEKHEMPVNIWMKLIDETFWTYPTYTLFGGEPLMYSHFRDLLSYIASKGCKAEVVTNGFYLSDYATDIVKSNCKLIISMSGTKDIHNRIKRNTRSYDKIMDSINRINSIDSKYLENVLINIVLLPSNIGYIPELIHTLRQFNISNFTLQHPQWFPKQTVQTTNYIWNKEMGKNFNLELNMPKTYSFTHQYIAEILNLKKRLYDFYSDCNITFFPSFEDYSKLQLYYDNNSHYAVETDSVCVVPWLNPSIDICGNVRSCIDNIIGNLKDNSFWNIWNNDINEIFRKHLMLHGKYPACTRCCLFYEKFV